MSAGRPGNLRVLVIIFLLAVIAAGGITIWSRYSPGQPVEISISPARESRGDIYIGGEVSNPGLYPLRAGDSLDSIIQAAGGTTDSADLSRLQLHVPTAGDGEQPQKVNLNRAEAWLLEALPGIGEIRARAIIDYRRQNGQFRNISELMNVEGIGAATYENIKDLLTVDD